MNIYRISPDRVDTLPNAGGTYLLLFRVDEPLRVRVGRLGPLTLEGGWYAYVGSAHGPGGLRARVRRHVRGSSRRHWHIDYITHILPPHTIYYTVAPVPLECHWVHTLLAHPGVHAPLPGLGSSDCRQGCPAHFLRIPSEKIQPWLEEGMSYIVHERPTAGGQR